MRTKEHDCAMDQMSTEAVAYAAEMLRQLAHPARLKIIDLLHTADELSVGEISEYLNLTQSTTSQHLNQMRRAKLLVSERRGKAVWYSVADHRPVALLNCICNCCETPIK